MPKISMEPSYYYIFFVRKHFSLKKLPSHQFLLCTSFDQTGESVYLRLIKMSANSCSLEADNHMSNSVELHLSSAHNPLDGYDPHSSSTPALFSQPHEISKSTSNHPFPGEHNTSHSTSTTSNPSPLHIDPVSDPHLDHILESPTLPISDSAYSPVAEHELPPQPTDLPVPGSSHETDPSFGSLPPHPSLPYPPPGFYPPYYDPIESAKWGTPGTTAEPSGFLSQPCPFTDPSGFDPSSLYDPNMGSYPPPLDPHYLNPETGLRTPTPQRCTPAQRTGP